MSISGWDPIAVKFIRDQASNPASPDAARFKSLLAKTESGALPSNEDVGFLVHHLELAAKELRSMYEAEAEIKEANELMELMSRLSGLSKK